MKPTKPTRTLNHLNLVKKGTQKRVALYKAQLEMAKKPQS